MKIAIPCAEKQLCAHFGHCEEFALVTVDREKGTIGDTAWETPPPHEPGLLPRWLGEKDVNLVIAGGMGMRAQQLFVDRGIKVVTGAPVGSPEALIRSWLDDSLKTGANLCDH